MSYVSYSAVIWDGKYSGITINYFSNMELVSDVASPDILVPVPLVVNTDSSPTPSLDEENLEKSRWEASYKSHFVVDGSFLKARISSIKQKLKLLNINGKLYKYKHISLNENTLTESEVEKACKSSGEFKNKHLFSSEDYLNLV